MKNKLVRLIFVLGIIFMCATVCGCSIGMDSLEDILNKNDLTAQITYYSNGGWFNNDSDSISRDIYYKENSKAFEITDSTQTKIKHSKYVYAGWYTIKTEKVDGENYFVCDMSEGQASDFLIDGTSVIFQKDGNDLIKITDYEKLVESVNVPLLVLEQPFDFQNQTLAKGDKLYLATKWVPNQKVEYVLLTEECSSITVRNEDGSTTTFKDREVIASELFDSNGIFTVPTDYKLSPVDSEEATFIDYYEYSENPDLDNLIRLSDKTQTLARPEDGSNIKVFVKYIADNWKIIRFAEDVKSIFSSPSNKYYLSRDVDCSELKAFNTVGETFKGTIRGNGYTISGIKTEASRLSNGANIAIFGELTQGAVIKDVTFKDISLTCTTRPNASLNIHLFSSGITNGVKPTITNVKIDGAKLNITMADGVAIENIPNQNTGFKVDSWFCRGFANSQFLSEFSTLKLENYQLIINDTIVATDKVA